MTVAELIEKLKAVPQDSIVWVDASTCPNAMFSTLANDITNVRYELIDKLTVISAVWHRDK